ncbi:MarR family transcriptional regulator [Chelativorans sp. ZYF759]|uniref:MarR family winged helix-turn-helix transcriptional regulator n=1 Tax=Chelativorans sp. ZYF759 TaxID=2692213 RepID=UPI00145F8E0B|nr:MarR family winged helix-turn-helix transcriptional regulator [Chelativorans sp. ZYF759]NMG41028.1 MarR family transcriptional regulator [Chelativorans sp. ZYF759]
MSMRKVHSTHIKKSLPELHRALVDITILMNSPERDTQLLEMAGLRLERALFPLLVGIERRGPIGVVELADGVGRDYTTVSRQVARLEELGLVERRSGASDKRVREAVITPHGKQATDALDAAREKMALTLFRNWSREDFDELIRLMRMLADGMSANPA